MVRMALLALEAGTKDKLMRPGPPLRFWQSSLRRPSFWLGLFVACFLAWAWWDSYGYLTRVWLVLDSREVEIVRIGGRTWLPDMSMGAVKLGVGFTHDDLTSFPQSEPAEPGGVPDSLIFFSFVGPWGGWLVWRWKRERRKPA